MLFSSATREPWQTLRPSDLVLLPRVLWHLGEVLYYQNRLSMPALVRRFDATPAAPPPPEQRDREALKHVLWATRGLLERIYKADYCMKQSLVLLRLLSERGFPVRIVFGVTKAPDRLDGHAWVELDGVPIGERKDPRPTFKVTFDYTAGDAATEAAPALEAGA